MIQKGNSSNIGSFDFNQFAQFAAAASSVVPTASNSAFNFFQGSNLEPAVSFQTPNMGTTVKPEMTEARDDNDEPALKRSRLLMPSSVQAAPEPTLQHESTQQFGKCGNLFTLTHHCYYCFCCCRRFG